MTQLPPKFRLRPLSAAVMLAALSANAAAVPVNWVPNADGFWDVTTNWSSNPALPGGADDVTIDVGAATVRTITFRSGAVTINSLVSQENLALTGGTLTLNNASTISAGFTQNGGVLSGAGNLTVAGSSELGTPGNAGSSMSGAGTTRFDGALSITGSGTHDFSGGRRLLTTGTTTWTNSAGGNGVFRLGTGAVIENQGLWFDNTSVSSSINVSFGGVGTFINSAAGIFQKTTGTTTTISTGFTNDGAIDVGNGTLLLSGGGTLNGSYSVAAGATLELAGGAFALNSTSVALPGRLRVNGATVNQVGILAPSGAGTLEVSNGTLNVGGAMTVARYIQSGGTVNGTGTLAMTGAASQWTGGAMSGSGATINSGTLAISGDNLKDLTSRTLRNAVGGTINWSTVNASFGRIRTGSGANLENLGQWNDTNTVANRISNDFGGAASTFNNSGTYTKSGAGLSELGIAFNHTGALQLQAGTLRLSGGATLAGSTDVDAGTTLELSGGTTSVNGGTLTLDGRLLLNGATVTESGALTVAGSGAIELAAGTLTVNGSIDTANYLQSGGTLDGGGTVTLTGNASQWTGGTMAGAGLTLNNGTLSLSGDNPKDIQSRTLRNAAGGTVNWSAVTGNNGRIRTGSGALLDNLGQWNDINTVANRISNDFGGAVATFANSGTYTKSGAALTEMGIAFNHTGSLQLQAGTLRLSRGGSLTGSTDVDAGATLEMSSGATAINGGALTLDGRLLLSGATVTESGVLTVGGSGDIELAGGTLTVNGSVSTPNYVQSGGTLGGTGTVTLTGSASQWTGGGMDGSGLTVNQGTLTLSGDSVKDLTARTLRNAAGATVNWSANTADNGRIRTGSGATIDNQGLWNDTSAVATRLSNDFGGGSTFANSGTYAKSGASTTAIGGAFSNSGLVTIGAGVLRLTGGGNDVSGDFTGAGTLEFSGGTRSSDAASTITATNVTFSGGQTTFAGNYNITGTTLVNGGTANLTGNLTNLGSAVALTAGTLNLSGSNAEIADYSHTGGTLSGSGLVTLTDSDAQWTAGAMDGSGVTVNTGTLTLGGLTLKDITARTLRNAVGGTIHWSTNTADSGRIRTGSGATFDNQGLWHDASALSNRISNDFGGGSTFINSGTYTKSGAGTTSINATFNNSGLVDVQAGALRLVGSGTDLGGDYSGAGTLEFSGGTRNSDAASTISTGNVTFSGGVVNFAGDYDITGTTTVSGGTANLTGTLGSLGSALSLTSGVLNLDDSDAAVGSFSQTGGTLTGSGVVTLSGSNSLWAGGTMTGAGITLNTGVLNLSGDTLRDLTTRTLRNAAGGTINWSTVGVDGGRIRTGSAATFDNRGQWNDNNALSNRISNDLGGVQATFANSGTYTKNGAGTTSINIAFNNTGTLDVEAGVLVLNADVAQHVGNTLSGGGWRVGGSGTLNLNEPGAQNITTNQGDVTLDGAGASFARINTLTNNQGAFRLLGARNFSAVGTFSNSGVLQLAGGSFAAPGLANSATGEIFGFGTVSPVVLNSGMVRASGGTLTASNGIDGQSGTLQSDAGATLALGADSDGDFLVNNGSLSLGTSNVTVAEDYTNANFGEGNAFDARANVSGSGQILASGDVAQALSGQLVDGGTANPGMNFGNIHVGDSVTRQYSIANTGASGPALRGAIQTSVNGGNLDDARLSGSGVTASNFGPVAAGASSAALDVTLTGSSAGALSGQSVAVVNNFDNVAEQVLSISGAVFRYANPTAHTPEPINFGNRRVGDVTNQALTISNDVANDGFSERLDASIGGVTGQATSNDGSFTLLAAGASDNASLAVGIDTATAGHKAGTATITLTSNGAGTSDLGTTALGTQTVNVSGDVFRLASASAHTPEPVVFANRHVGDGASQALSLTNTAANDGFSERLNASIGGATGNVTSNNGSFALLSAGATDSSALTVGIDTSSAGHKSGTATISLASDGAGTSGFAALALGTQTVNVSGDVYRLASASAHTPEPINFGNRRVGDVTNQALTLSNDVANDGFSERLDASIGGVTGQATSNDGSFALLAAGASDNASLAVGIDTATAGHKAGTATITLTSNGAGTSDLGTTALGTQTVNVSGDVFRLASASAHTPEPVVFANRHVGDDASQALSLTNTAANDGFSERLNASIGGATGNATSNNGSFALLSAGATDSSALTVGIDTSSAGHKSGTATISLASDGAGTSGFAALALGTQTVNVSGDVYRLASASAHTPEPINFGNRRVGDVTNQALTLSNDVANDGFSERLDASIGGVTGQATSNDGSFALLAAGASDNASLAVGIDTATAGHKAGTATITLTSNGAGTSDLGTTALGTQTVNVSGDVFRLASASAHTPEPVVFANRHVGDDASQALSLTNTAANDGFSERLNASIGGVTGNATSNNGSFALLNAGATDSSALTVGIDTSSAGHKSGTATISLASDGAGTSGFAALALGTQTVNVSGDVYRLASAGTVAAVQFGNVHVGDVATRTLSLTNTALADGFSEGLDAVFGGVSDTRIQTSGSVSGLAAGATDAGSLVVSLDTATAGNLTGFATLQFTSNGAGTSGLGLTAIGSQNVGVSTNVAVWRLAEGSLDNGQPVDFGAHRVGDSPATVGVVVRNGAANDGFSEALNASVGSVDAGFSATGSANLIAAGASDGSAIQVGLDTSTAGVKSGNARINYVSDGAGTSGLGQSAAGSQDLAMSGRVYGQAVAALDTTSVDFGIVHVGDLVGEQAVTVRNLALGSLTDNLLGSISVVPAGFSGNGSLGAAGLAQNAVSSALSIGLDTGAAGVFNGNATLVFASHNDELADLALDDQSVAVHAVVNNFANPTLTETSGAGALASASAGHFVYDFGRLTSGAGSVNGLLALTNFITGPADTLGADFDIDGGAFSLGGFDSFAALGTGDAHDLSVSFNPLVVGLFEQVVRINLFGENASGFHGSLGTFELTLRADVQAVPVPGAVWLFGSALAGIAGWSRRRKASA